VTSPHWDVLVPLKPLRLAKSRLNRVGPGIREQLARAMSLDTIEAVASCPRPVRVHVVCDDPCLIGDVRAVARSARIHRDMPPGLNEALTVAARRLKCTSSLGTVVVLGDLPALRGADLAQFLDRAGVVGRAVVADRDGTGSTVLAVPAGAPLDASFGQGSFRRHVSGGAVPVEAAAGLRCDVDQVEDLAFAWRLGLGRRTALIAGTATARARCVLVDDLGPSCGTSHLDSRSRDPHPGHRPLHEGGERPG
jgi:2-phospho-L-lactate guanylyltransferase